MLSFTVLFSPIEARETEGEDRAIEVRSVSITSPQTNPGQFAINVTIRGNIIPASKKTNSEIYLSCGDTNILMKKINLDG